MRYVQKKKHAVLRRGGALLLTLAVLFGMVPLTAMAQADGETPSCLHSCGDGSCSYAAGQDCDAPSAGHGEECDPECTDAHAACSGDDHDAACGFVPGVACDHVCSEENGCLQAGGDEPGDGEPGDQGGTGDQGGDTNPGEGGENPGEGSPDNQPAKAPATETRNIVLTLTGFDALADEVAAQTLALGGSEAELTLPAQLEATGEDGAVTVANVTWACADFDAQTAGSYIFTAVLPEGFALEEGVELPTIAVAVVDPNTVVFSATFDKVDMLGESDRFFTEYREAYNVPRILNVTENFESATGTKKLVITLGKGLALHSAPGMVLADEKANTWTFNASTLEGMYSEVIESGVWTPVDPDTVGDFQAKAGTLVYTLKPAAKAINLNVFSKVERTYMPYTEVQTLENAVQVFSFDGDGELHSAVLEKYAIKEFGSFCVVPHGITKITARGESYSAGMRFWLSSANDLQPKWQHGEISFTIAMPKDLGLTGVTLEAPEGTDQSSTHSAADCIIGKIDSTDATYDYVTLTIDAEAELGYMAFWLEGTVKEDAATGNQWVRVPSGSVTRWDGTTCEMAPGGTVLMTISDGRGELDLAAVDRTVYAQEKDAPAYMRPLGIMGWIWNRQAATVSGRRMVVDFDTTNVGVMAARLLCGIDGAKDIVVTTTKGRTIKIDVLEPTIINTNPAAPSNYATLNLADDSKWGDKALQDGEYIKNLEYLLGDILPGAQTGTTFGYASVSNVNGGGLYYYGVLHTSNNYQASTTLYKPVVEEENPEAPQTWEEVSSIACKTTVEATVPEMLDVQAGSSVSEIRTGEAAKTFYAVYYPLSYRYDNTVLSYKGWVSYVRQIRGTTIDPDSIRAEWKDPVTSEVLRVYTPTYSFTDDTGCLVYAIEMPDEIMGDMTKQMTSYGQLGVWAKVSANSMAVDAVVPVYEMFHGQVYDRPEVTYSGGDRTTVANDPYGYAGKGNSKGGYMVGPATNIHTFVVKGDSAFQVLASASRGDGEWKTYNSDSPSYVEMNPRLQAHYALDVVNNSGKAVAQNVFHALIPVPKEGENTGNSQLQAEDFGWSLNVEKEIVLEGYSVSYATSYLSDPSASGWQSWGAIGDKSQIRMIKIAPNAGLPQGYSERLSFPMAVVPQGDDAVRLQGSVNTYSSLIHINLGGNANTQPSAKVALRLNTGVISGTVRIDNDRSATLSDGDAGLQGVSVAAYAAGTDTLLDSATTSAGGSYRLTGLGADEQVDLVFSNPGTQQDGMRYVLPSLLATGADLTLENVSPSADVANAPVVLDAMLQRPWTVQFVVPKSYDPVADQKVYPQGKATQPDLPANPGMIFTGWFGEDGTKWDFANLVTSDMTLTARWTPIVINYLVEYNGNGHTGGSLPSGGSYPEGEEVVVGSEEPTLEGFVFTGWEASMGGTYIGGDSFDMPAGDVTLTAQWEPEQVVVEYVIHHYLEGTTTRVAPSQTGNGLVDSEVTGRAASLPRYTPDAQTKTMVLQKTAEGVINELIFEYRANVYTVRFFDHDNSQLGASQRVEYGQSAVAPPNPSRDGYAFTGWDKPYTNITKDTDVYALYRPLNINAGENEETPPDEPEDPPREGEEEPPEDPDDPIRGGDEPDDEELLPVEEPHPEDPRLAQQTGNILQDVLGGRVPLSNFSGGAWSLLSLLCAIVGLVMCIVLFARALARPKQELEEGEDDEVLAQYMLSEEEMQEREAQNNRWTLPRVLVMILGLLPGLLFLILDDLSKPMAWVNQYTIWVVLALVLAIAAVVLQAVAKRRKALQDDASDLPEQGTEPSQA